MIRFPNAKINLGLNVIERRADGYHNIETLFYPTGLCDVLEVLPSDSFAFSSSGLTLDADSEQNLVVKAYRILQSDFKLPPVAIHLHKIIPFGAGLGGGSSDAASMLQMLNRMFNLSIDPGNLADYATRLGADCPFFLHNQPAIARGIGDILEPSECSLLDWYLVLIKPDFGINTAWAYRQLIPGRPAISPGTVLKHSVDDWKGLLKNDFEAAVVTQYPEIGEIVKTLYDAGAAYVAMSGSGSAVYGLFRKVPEGLAGHFPADYFYYQERCRY